jgi:ribonuclease BN (tRNA processing enzyme)
MEWIVLGTGTATPDRLRGSAAHLLAGNGVAALFDSASSTKDRLPRMGIAFGTLSHMLYAYAHLDHWADVLPLLFYRASAPERDRRPGLVVGGPAEFVELARNVATCTVGWRDKPQRTQRAQIFGVFAPRGRGQTTSSFCAFCGFCGSFSGDQPHRSHSCLQQGSRGRNNPFMLTSL